MASRKIRTVEERFWSKVDKSAGPDGCWLWTASTVRGGYGWFRDSHEKRAHRVAYLLTHGSIPAGLRVCHACDNPPCVNPKHLFAATAAENTRDMMNKGRFIVGDHAEESNGRSKLKAADIPNICARLSRGDTCMNVAKDYGVSESTIGHIKAGRTWPRHTQIRAASSPGTCLQPTQAQDPSR